MADLIATDYCAFPALGLAGSSSKGISITAPGSNNTLGANTQIEASTSDEANGFIVALNSNAGGSGSSQTLTNIYIGGSGSEQILVSGLQLGRTSSCGGAQRFYTIPLNIPQGSRLSAKYQADVAANASDHRISIVPLGVGFSSALPCDAFEAWGVDTATSMGTLATASASAYTKGSWAELIASTGIDSQQIILQLQRFGAQAAYRIDIGIGAGGSEVVAVPDINFVVGSDGANDASMYVGRDQTIHIPLTVKAGSRVAIRIESSTGSATARASILAFGN